MTFRAAPFPGEPRGVSSGSEWRSLGEITGRVLRRARVQCGISSVARAIRCDENDNWPAAIPRAGQNIKGVASPPSTRDRQAL